MTTMILFPLRFINFLVGFISYWMEVGADWIIGVQRKTAYVREGKCKQCGRCCKMIALIVPKGVSKRGYLVKFFKVWHKLAMNFEHVDEEEGWLIYRCGYYREECEGKGRCSIHPVRHRICRFFPRQRLYDHPRLHPDCGFKFVRRDVREKLDEARREKKVVFGDVVTQKSKKELKDFGHIELE